MKCRGWRGRFYAFVPCSINGGDIAFAMLALTGMVMLIAMEWTCGHP
jgi:hypothetical protein